MLQEYCACRLQGVDPDACAGDDGCGRWVDLKLLRYEFHAGQEWGLLWDGYAKIEIIKVAALTS
jgi:hypothetical protein